MFDFLYNEISLRKILGETKKIQITPERYMKAQLSLGFDLACIFFDAPEGYRARRSQDTVIDEWGSKSKTVGDMGWYIGGTIRTSQDLEKLHIPDPNAPGRTKSIQKILKKYGDNLACAPAVGGAFTHAWGMTGLEIFVKSIYTDPSFVHKILYLVNRYNVELGKIAIDEGAEFLWIADDFGDSHGPMLPPKQFRDFILPYFRGQVHAFKKRGVWVLLHCDGNIMPIIEDVVNTGIDAFHPIERKALMNLIEMKEKYGDRITLIGNVEASNLIPYGSYEEIDKQIKECFETAAPGGGYIFASDHSIHPGIPLEKAKFLFNRAQKYRKYPTIK
jgi:uroporphyrinogen decarboxylase